MASPKLVPVVLTDGERRALEQLTRRRKTSQALALRARIVLACAGGAPVTAVAADLGLTWATVAKWRSRFLEARPEGLGDAPRPGAPRTITDEQVELVIAKTLTERAQARTRTGRPVDGRGDCDELDGNLADLAGVRGSSPI
jgi:hypothetical protein